jgi:hypothetical protein
VFPTTSIPIYVNMFTTVTRTYFYILFSYLAFIMSFSYSFFLIFGGQVRVRPYMTSRSWGRRRRIS